MQKSGFLKYATLTVLLAVFLFLSSCGTVDDSADPAQDADTLTNDEFIPLDPLVESGTLENGLRWYIRSNQEPEQRASLRLVVNAGSILEMDDQQGLAHFCEHMAFNGTENFEKSELIDYLELIGMSFGPDINAYTGFDETVYTLEIPTADDDTVATAFQVLEDWAHLVSYEDEEVEKERGVIQEEWRLGRGVSGRILDKMIPVIFKGSAYAERLPIGKPEVFMNAPPQRLRDFYNTWYRPDLMAVIVVGDIEPEKTKALIEKHFSYEGPENPEYRPEHPVETAGETEVCMISDPELAYATVELSAKTEPPRLRTEGDYRRSLVESLTWSMFNSRLSEIARKPEPPFIGAGGGAGDIVRPAGNISCYASADADGVQEALTAMVAELERAGRWGFTQAELDRKKADFLNSVEEYYLERDNIPSSGLADELIDNFLKDVFVPGVVAEYELYNRFIPEISLEDVNSYAVDLMPESGRTITLIYPEGAEVPDSGQVKAVVESGSSMSLEPYFDDSLDRDLVDTPPVAGAVVEKRYYESIDTELWHLSNGADVILKQTDFKDDEVLFSAFSRGGLSLHSDEEYIAGLYAPLLQSLSGLGAFNSIQLGKKLSGLSVSLSPYIGRAWEGMSGSFSPDELEVFMQLLYLYYTEPVFSPDACDNMKVRLESLIENRNADPMNVYYDRVRAILSQDDYRSKPLDSERLDGIVADVSDSVFRERFSGADDFIFVFTGNIDKQELEAACTVWIAGLPSGSGPEQPFDRGVRPPEGIVSETVYRGIEEQGRVRIIFTTELEAWSPDIELQIETSASVMETLFRESLREDAGGTYHISVNPVVEREPYPSVTMSIEFGCDPDRADELSAGIFEIINKVAGGELEDKYITIQEQQYRLGYEQSIEENSFWLAHLEDAFGFGDDPEDLLPPDKFNEQISRESVIESVGRYYNTGEYITVVLMPEE
ncbi:MAG: insulinase family protein [Spirochaetales bacterium]|uniref:Insulinase family protein n=1 Tax=Candidatus Thalassospirochaeta sargassi TaxID=3119039 RepID=A0AAJ1IFW5_9SPIO|nr:insulinase family protein [Spirochaetales bacterium]